MKTLTLHIILILGLAISGFSQKEISFEEMGEYYELIEKYYTQDSYSIDVIYQSFKGHQSTIPADQMSGFVIKDKGLIESLQLGIYSIQNKEVKVLVDSTEMYVGITYPDTASTQGFNKDIFEQSKGRIEKIEQSKRGRDVLVRFKFKPGYQYESVEILIAPKGLIKEMTLLFSSDLEYETANGEKAREKAKVVIKSTESNRKIKNDVSSILTKQGTGYALKKVYQSFELMDFRYQTN